ncbi:MAG TPA: MerR family transcriptional regulator [Thermoanaerobaculia bacterium]|jgi:DNA-binding transcriptional MerR regulator|nr:MerR family transcriptional regulator [Thermoanaerobaculia bacterium]
MARAATEEKLYKIGEVCKLADLQPYVLRYWETEFPSLAPGKSGGGQRLYNRGEVDIILRIKELLYKEGFTIAGAKKKLEMELAQPAAAAVPAVGGETAAPPDLSRVKQELRAILKMLGD